MKNGIQPGNVLTVPAPTGGTVSGKAYKIGNTLGIAATTEAAGDPVGLELVGVFLVDKVAAETWTFGLPIYWDDTAKLFTTVSTNNKHYGGVAGPAAANSVSGLVRLNGVTPA